MQTTVRPRIGLLPTGHHYYWDQSPSLRELGQKMYARLRGMLDSVGDVVVPGPILKIGNCNCRVRVRLPSHDFMDAWCQQGPSHHVALSW